MIFYHSFNMLSHHKFLLKWAVNRRLQYGNKVSWHASWNCYIMINMIRHNHTCNKSLCWNFWIVNERSVVVNWHVYKVFAMVKEIGTKLHNKRHISYPMGMFINDEVGVLSSSVRHINKWWSSPPPKWSKKIIH